MIVTNLYTRTGVFVTEILLPPFKIKPEIVQWGARYFVWRNTHQKYMEGLVWVDLTEVSAHDYVMREMSSGDDE